MAFRLVVALLMVMLLGGYAHADDDWTLVYTKDRSGQSLAFVDALKTGLERHNGVRQVTVEARPADSRVLAEFIGNALGTGETLLIQSASQLLGTEDDDAPLWRRTPVVAAVATDYEALAIDTRSPIASLDTLLQAFHDHPRVYAIIGGSERGGIDHAMVAWIERTARLEAGVIRYLPSGDTAEAVDRLRAGEAGVILGARCELRRAQQQGLVRILATSAPQRESPDDPPTFAEQGLDIIFHNWQGLLAASQTSENRVADMARTLTAVAQTPYWQQALTAMGWTPYAKAGQDFQELIETQDSLMRSLIRSTLR